MQNLLEDLKALLTAEPKYLIDGEVNKNKVVEDALRLEPCLLKLLLKNGDIKDAFFVVVDGVAVFDKVKFQEFVSNKAFLPDSYTAFKNKIGLNVDGKFIKNSNDVVLSWAYKDCVLEGGMTKEDISGNVAEIFYNETLAPNEINRLLDKKVLTNFEFWDAEAVAADKAKKRQKITENDNLLIKGNNLIALHCLKARYAGKVKLIYIDPPYNTGNDGFRYNDSFNHSTWLTFMKNRLEVARELLAEDGVIFVNLDDGEAHYCKILMDEIFGKENFVANVVWQKKYSPQNDAKWFSDNHDHILVSAKNKEKWRPNLLPRTEEMNERYSNPDNDPRGDWKSGDLSVKRVTEKDIYPITTPTGRIVMPPKGRSWVFGKEKLEGLIKDNRIWFGETGNNVPSIKQFLSEVKDGITSMTIWTYQEVGHNQDAKKEIKSLGFADIFATPKPEKLIERIINLATKPNDIVLDFFAGSGTAPSVAHKMGRRWIAIEQMNYIQDLPEARLKKVVAGEQGGISKAVNWQGGGSFVYLELKEWNEEFINKIKDAKDTAELLTIYAQMQKEREYFLRYDFEQLKFDRAEFANLELAEQKKILCQILNKNHLYVNYSEKNDVDYKISEEDKKLTASFYGE